MPDFRCQLEEAIDPPHLFFLLKNLQEPARYGANFQEFHRIGTVAIHDKTSGLVRRFARLLPRADFVYGELVNQGPGKFRQVERLLQRVISRVDISLWHLAFSDD